MPAPADKTIVIQEIDIFDPDQPLDQDLSNQSDGILLRETLVEQYHFTDPHGVHVVMKSEANTIVQVFLPLTIYTPLTANRPRLVAEVDFHFPWPDDTEA